jgi:flagellar motility protein MotE (MotC chaperone)
MTRQRRASFKVQRSDRPFAPVEGAVSHVIRSGIPTLLVLIAAFGPAVGASNAEGSGKPAEPVNMVEAVADGPGKAAAPRNKDTGAAGASRKAAGPPRHGAGAGSRKAAVPLATGAAVDGSGKAAAPLAPGAGAADGPRKTAPPLNIAASAKGAPPPPGWNDRVRPSRKIKTRAAAAAAPAATGDAVDVTGAVSGKSTQPPGRTGAAKPVPPETDPALFCTNIADAATDARLAWQMNELQKAETRLRERIAELEAKRAEYEKWLKLRDDFLRKAEDNVITIYSRMRPEAAALQIASMNDDTAAAVLAKLNPRNSSAILNEMEPARAAHLANTLSGMRQVDTGKAAK